MISESKGKGRGAWVLVFSKDMKHVMMAKRSHLANNPNLWNFWGGGVDLGEKPSQGASRELYEESGLHVKPKDLTLIQKVGDRFYYGIRTNLTVKPVINMAENTEYKWVKAKDLGKGCLKCNPPTKVALHHNLPRTRKPLKYKKL